MPCSDPHEATTKTLELKVMIGENPNLQRENPFDRFENPKSTTMSNAKAPYNSLTRLSPQSLELCTENLGSETGTETIFTGDEAVIQEPSKQLLKQHSFAAEERSYIKLQKRHLGRAVRSQKNNRSSSFPPPLTTMSGPSSLKVVMRRENGRLIVEAVERPSRSGVLQAERSGGRLRLCFVNDSTEEMIGDEKVEEMNGPAREGVDDDHELEKDVGGDNNYQWMSRCKDGGRGGNKNRSEDNHWNKPSLWIVSS